MRRRDYKETAAGAIYHIYNRGNNKERIFYDEQDYRAFLYRVGLIMGLDQKKLNETELTKMPKTRIRITKSYPDKFKIHSFCVMPNHFHLLIEQQSDVSISKFMHKLCTSFSMYLNKKYRRVGHVFQERFKSSVIENNAQLMWVSSYIHMNPIKDNIIINPYEYKWSSYNCFASDQYNPIVCKDLIGEIFGNAENFINETFTLQKDGKDSP